MTHPFLDEQLKTRGVPEIWDGTGDWETRRREIVDLLCREVYGTPVAKPQSLSWDVMEKITNFCAGKAPRQVVKLTAQVNGSVFSFPISVVLPKRPKGVKLPFFVFVNFRPEVPDSYLPSEELADLGYGVISFYYENVTSDNNDYSNGLAGILNGGNTERSIDTGKILMWSWACSRCLDYAAQALSDKLDLNRAFVTGHSRLGKTALVTGMLDTRFACALSNDSGCSGAALARGTIGETVEQITTRFPFWFSPAYTKYNGRENTMPFDQNFLIAAQAPRPVHIASAEEDTWADPASEFLSGYAASSVYEKLGLNGLCTPDRLPQVDDVYPAGCIGYQMRPGLHYLSRQDWQRACAFLDQHFPRT